MFKLFAPLLQFHESDIFAAVKPCFNLRSLSLKEEDFSQQNRPLLLKLGPHTSKSLLVLELEESFTVSEMETVGLWAAHEFSIAAS